MASNIYRDLSERLLNVTQATPIEVGKREQALRKVEEVTAPIVKGQLQEILLPSAIEGAKQKAYTEEEIGKEYAVDPMRVKLMKDYGTPTDKKLAGRYEKYINVDPKNIKNTKELEEYRTLRRLMTDRRYSTGRSELKQMAMAGSSTGEMFKLQFKKMLDEAKESKLRYREIAKTLTDQLLPKMPQATVNDKTFVRNFLGNLDINFTPEAQAANIPLNVLDTLSREIINYDESKAQKVFNNVKSSFQDAMQKIEDKYSKATTPKEELMKKAEIINLILDAQSLRNKQGLSRVHEEIGKEEFDKVAKRYGITPKLFKTGKIGIDNLEKNLGKWAEIILKNNIPDYEEQYDDFMKDLTEDIGNVINRNRPKWKQFLTLSGTPFVRVPNPLELLLGRNIRPGNVKKFTENFLQSDKTEKMLSLLTPEEKQIFDTLELKARSIEK